VGGGGVCVGRERVGTEEKGKERGKRGGKSGKVREGRG